MEFLFFVKATKQGKEDTKVGGNVFYRGEENIALYLFTSTCFFFLLCWLLIIITLVNTDLKMLISHHLYLVPFKVQLKGMEACGCGRTEHMPYALVGNLNVGQSIGTHCLAGICMLSEGPVRTLSGTHLISTVPKRLVTCPFPLPLTLDLVITTMPTN